MYTLVILKATRDLNEPGAEEIVREHGRRNFPFGRKEFSLRQEGKLSMVCPVIDGTEVKGVGIFSIDEEETKKIEAVNIRKWRITLL